MTDTAVPFSALRDPVALAAALEAEPAVAARWLEAASLYGLVEAQAAFAQCLLDGRGVPRDPARAFAWFSMAAAAGHIPAVNMVGRCCELGWGTPVDHARAASCYRRAAEAGLDWAQYNLGNMTLRGRGVPRDRAAARSLYQAAAAQGLAKAMNMLGRFLEEGWEGPVDRAAAAAWYNKAARGDDFRAQYNLASLLAAHGRVSEACAWLRRAAALATAEFRVTMAQRLSGSAEAAIRAIGAELAAKRQGQGRCP